jgi:hypothetical protein
MTIDRTQFNALVDDSGSGTDGSVWDKSKIQSVLLDPIDVLVETKSTWTPVLNFGGATTGITYTTQTGTYTRSGNIIVAEMRIVLSSKGSATGAATITGLPVSALGTPIGSVIDFGVGGAGMTGAPFAVISGTTLFLVQTAAAARTSLADTNFTNTTDIRISAIYRV